MDDDIDPERIRMRTHQPTADHVRRRTAKGG